MAGEKQNELYDAIGIAISISNLVLNFSLAYALKRLKKLKIVSYRFIFWLSLSDFFVGATGTLHHAGRLLQVDKKLILATFLLLGFFFHFSVYLTITIAIDRFIHMKLLKGYGSFMTIRKCNVMLLVSTILAAATYLFKKFIPEIFLIASIFVFFLLCIVYISTYLSIKNSVKKIELHSGLKDTDLSPQTEPRCANLVNDHDNQNNIGNNVIQANFTPNPEACLAKQGEEQQRISAGNHIFAIPNRERREKTAKKCNKLGVEKRDAAEDVHLSKDLKSQIVATSKARSKRPETEFGKAMIFILAGFTITFLPVYIILLFQTMSPSIVESFPNGYFFLLPSLNSSFNALIFIAFSSELKRYFKTRIIQIY
ncbi:uncharacterized protein LOC135685463 [Rhopilema esculentum]|uniref:uncharacterized protein LOC135685463 n=1 Tax=Rhopilema esculentum TaxID=499914 RepID=UPI0031E0DDF7